MKSYTSPQLVDYGQIGAVTGIFGAEQVEDQSYDPQGAVIARGTGSINQCATPQPGRSVCL